MNAPSNLARRELLILAGAACASACTPTTTMLCAEPDSGTPGPDASAACPPHNATDMGAAADFPLGAGLQRATSPDGVEAFVGHDAAGFWAVATTCPHFGGLLVLASDGTLHCTNMPTAEHGAIFDVEGRPTRDPLSGWGSPCARPTQAYPVTICNGRVYLTPGSVPVGTRAAAT